MNDLNAATRGGGPSDSDSVQTSANPENEVPAPLLRTIVHGDLKGQLLVLRDVLSATSKSLPRVEALPEKEVVFLMDPVSVGRIDIQA